jgi:hypothetical protein
MPSAAPPEFPSGNGIITSILFEMKLNGSEFDCISRKIHVNGMRTLNIQISDTDYSISDNVIIWKAYEHFLCL